MFLVFIRTHDSLDRLSLLLAVLVQFFLLEEQVAVAPIGLLP